MHFMDDFPLELVNSMLLIL
ncbi:hypothetical protein F383_11312 [Gossypium arboreum]|uniref:Uncharacterized protein n=1 Tax=Gossypium arboreum TaxID=29729 RepID=A0A0B0NDD7_GOSAR|nr:hypothetical protein F383_11312 [Gossypium arboreum]